MRTKDIIDLKRLGLIGAVSLQGAAPSGFNTEGDVVTQTADGVDLNDIWRTFQQTLQVWNEARQAVVDFLTYGVQEPIVTVPQFGGGANFERASEFGLPRSARTTASYFQMGFDFEWYDVAERYTWKFLADATAEQVESVHQEILEADNRLVFGEVMKTLFDNANRSTDIKNQAYTVYALYNGDGTVPPPYKANTFDGTHTHYLVSGGATIDSGDLDDTVDHLLHHGYGPENGTDIVIMLNKVQGDVVRNFRSIANGGTARYDFIPAQGTPSLLMPKDMTVGSEGRPAAQIRGMKVIGAYGDATIVQEDYIPAGYLTAFATGGRESLTNPIGIREHRNAALRGLGLRKGRNADYPLQDAVYGRGFGTGIRQRGGAVVMQIKASGSYAPPAAYTR